MEECARLLIANGANLYAKGKVRCLHHIRTCMPHATVVVVSVSSICISNYKYHPLPPPPLAAVQGKASNPPFQFAIRYTWNTSLLLYMIEEHDFNILKMEWPPKYPLEFVQTIDMAKIMIDKMGVDPTAVDKVRAALYHLRQSHVNSGTHNATVLYSPSQKMDVSPFLIAGGRVSGREKWLQFLLDSGADPCYKDVSMPAITDALPVDGSRLCTLLCPSRCIYVG
jgi:hypothetical protein